MNVWLNGSIIDAEGAIDARDRGLTLGDGIFETLAFIDGMPLRTTRHFARLRTGAGVLAMPVPYTDGEMANAVKMLCIDQGAREGSARITLLRGPAPRGVAPPETATPTVIISVAAGDVGNASPVRAIVATTTRRNDRSPLAAIKSTNYLDAIIAAAEARNAGADDAIMLNTHDLVAEATAANVFCRIGGTLVTPPISDGALPGIMRACVMETQAVTERSIAPGELRGADEVFLSSSLSIRPVTRIDDHQIGDGTPGPVAAQLKELPRRAQ